MRKTKKGFSLAELLIAMGIVSIVATLGFSIAKRGIENAYDIYIYTGYRGITTAIGNATGRGIYIYKNPTPEDSSSVDLRAEFISDVAATLNAKQDGGKIKAPNGIFYTISFLKKTDEKRYYIVNMEVPAVKKNNVNRRTLCFAYAPDDDWSILIPVNGELMGCKSTIENLYDRMDLLPFFLDDGAAGRKLANGSYVPRKFISARQALCKVHGQITLPGETINCSGVDVSNAGHSYSRIKLTHPQKAN